MKRWVKLMSRHARKSNIVFSTAFFAWFRRHIVTIDDYAYEGVDFQGDRDLVLPEGAQWGAIGKNDSTMFFIFIRFIQCFCVFISFQD